MHVIIPINNLSAFLSKLDYSGSFYYIFKKAIFQIWKNYSRGGRAGYDTHLWVSPLYACVYTYTCVCICIFIYVRAYIMHILLSFIF